MNNNQNNIEIPVVRCDEEIEGLENMLGDLVISSVKHSLARMNSLTLTCMGVSADDIISEAVERFLEFQHTEDYREGIKAARNPENSIWDVYMTLFAKFNISVDLTPEGQEWKKFRQSVINKCRRDTFERKDGE